MALPNKRKYVIIMGILLLAFVLILVLIKLINVKQQLDRYQRRYLESFSSLKLVLGFRHRAVKNVVDAAQLYLLQEPQLGEHLAQSRDGAEKALLQTSRSLTADTVEALCGAEAQLNTLLKKLQSLIEQNCDGRHNSRLAGLLEILDAAENDVVSARRIYNRDAEHYNQLLQKPPVCWCAKHLGHNQAAGIVQFDDNNVMQMSRHLLM